MPIDSQELSELKARCTYANQYGYQVGHAAEYALQLAIEIGFEGMLDVSAYGVLGLIAQVEALRAAPPVVMSTPVVEVPPPVREPVKAKSKSVPAPAVRPPPAVEPKVEAPVVTEPDDSPVIVVTGESDEKAH